MEKISGKLQLSLSEGLRNTGEIPVKYEVPGCLGPLDCGSKKCQERCHLYGRPPRELLENTVRPLASNRLQDKVPDVSMITTPRSLTNFWPPDADGPDSTGMGYGTLRWATPIKDTVNVRHFYRTFIKCPLR